MYISDIESENIIFQSDSTIKYLVSLSSCFKFFVKSKIWFESFSIFSASFIIKSKSFSSDPSCFKVSLIINFSFPYMLRLS